MGPNAGRLGPEQLEAALDTLDYPFPVTGAVTISVSGTTG
jgi:hypothetical protein